MRAWLLYSTLLYLFLVFPVGLLLETAVAVVGFGHIVFGSAAVFVVVVAVDAALVVGFEIGYYQKMKMTAAAEFEDTAAAAERLAVGFLLKGDAKKPAAAAVEDTVAWLIHHQ